MPAISVVIPSYNRAELLPRAIQSVLDQTFTDFELIVVDDASTDHTSEVVDEDADARIRYIRQAQNRGVSAARNEGIDAARAPLVTFLDDDDEFLPRFLARTVRAHRAHPEAGFSWCGIVHVDESGQVLRRVNWSPSPKRNAYHEYLRHLGVGGAYGLAVKRSALTVVGRFDESLHYGEDIEFVARLFRFCLHVAIPEHLVLYRQHRGTRLSTSPEGDIALERLLSEHADAVEASGRVAASLYGRLGERYYRKGAEAKARSSILHALRRDPTFKLAWGALARHEWPFLWRLRNLVRRSE